MTKLRGYSLMELVVALSITTILSGAIVVILISGTENFSRISFRQQRDSTFYESYNRLSGYARVAQQFPNTYTHPTTKVVYTAGPTTTIMKVASKQADGRDCEGYYDYVIYTLDSSKKELREILVADPNSVRRSHDQVIAAHVGGVTFALTTIANELRQLTFTMRIDQKTPQDTIEKTHSQTIVVRNVKD